MNTDLQQLPSAPEKTDCSALPPEGAQAPLPQNTTLAVVSHYTSQGAFMLCSLRIQLWPLQRFNQVFYGHGKGFLLI